MLRFTQEHHTATITLQRCRVLTLWLVVLESARSCHEDSHLPHGLARVWQSRNVRTTMPGPMQSSGPFGVRSSRHCGQVTTAQCQDDRVLTHDAVRSSRIGFGSSHLHHARSTVLLLGVSHSLTQQSMPSVQCDPFGQHANHGQVTSARRQSVQFQMQCVSKAVVIDMIFHTWFWQHHNVE